MGVVEWLALISTVLKFAMILVEKMTKTPSEKRRASLDNLDRAITKARERRDLSDLSEWLGGRL